MDEAIGRMIEADETGGEGRRRRTCYTQLIRPEPETLILVDPMRHNRYMRLRKPPDEPLRAA